VTSKVNVGSHFYVDVMVKAGKKLSGEKIAPVRKVIGLLDKTHPPKILVVDDQPENRMVMQELLEQVGVVTVTAEDGEQAVRMSQEWKPDLIFMDLRMPVMNGYDSARQITTNPKTASIPIVAVTASIMSSERKKVEESGMSGFVRKPYKAEDLFSMIEEKLSPRFIYGDEPAMVGTKETTGAVLTRELVQVIPLDLREKMREATVKADLDELLKLIQQVKPYSSQVAKKLEDLANNYQYEALSNLFKKG
jgi:CheY-like chemotaxis protein